MLKKIQILNVSGLFILKELNIFSESKRSKNHRNYLLIENVSKAIFSQFLISASSLQGKMVMVITATLIDAGWYIFLALLLTVPKFKIHLQLNAEKIGFFLGILLLIVSFVLAVNIIRTFF